MAKFQAGQQIDVNGMYNIPEISSENDIKWSICVVLCKFGSFWLFLAMTSA